jgi:hypothetical protein
VKLLILYRPDSEHSTEVESFVRDFEHQHDVGNRVQLESVSTREGAATATLYDIMRYPALLAITDDGSVLNSWEGEPLPLMDEVAGYLYN